MARSRLIYLNNYCMYFHAILYTYSWSSEDESSWLWWFFDMSSAMCRSESSAILWNISTSMYLHILSRYSWFPLDVSQWIWCHHDVDRVSGQLFNGLSQNLVFNIHVSCRMNWWSFNFPSSTAISSKPLICPLYYQIPAKLLTFPSALQLNSMSMALLFMDIQWSFFLFGIMNQFPIRIFWLGF